MMDILPELRERGLVHDVTDEEGLRAKLAAGPVSFYCGYDPTAASLHAGNLVPLSVAARLARAGHRYIALVGGATGMVGDPSGKSSERKLLDPETLARNQRGLEAQLRRLVAAEAVFVNNHDWFGGIGYLEFLRDVGKHLTVNYMLAKESVRARLEDREQGISYTEFSYMLLQGYDFVHLARQMGCVLQLGGADQWGNITCGIELHRKMGGASQLFGLVAPLLLTSAGAKFGKSEGGQNVWLDPELTRPYDFYQFWLNAADEDVERYLMMFTFLALDEIAEVMRAHDPDRARRVAQRRLAEEVTRWVHGEEASDEAIAASQALFGGSAAAVLAHADAAPTHLVPRPSLPQPVVEICVAAGLASSKSEARRLIEQGGLYLNDVKIEGIGRTLGADDFGEPAAVLLRAGKKKIVVVKLTG
jgi:tyrosyl-tRNA synthetase